MVDEMQFLYHGIGIGQGMIFETMAPSFTEDHLIEQAAIQLMEHELGWDGRTSNIDRSTSKAEVKNGRDARTVVFQHGLDAAVEGLTRDRSSLSLVEANREIDKLLRGGQRTEGMTREEAAHA